MGEAKKRGTYEQRKAEAEAKQAERQRTIALVRSRRGKSRASLLAIAAMMTVSAAQQPAQGEKE